MGAMNMPPGTRLAWGSSTVLTAAALAAVVATVNAATNRYILIPSPDRSRARSVFRERVLLQSRHRRSQRSHRLPMRHLRRALPPRTHGSGLPADLLCSEHGPQG